MITLHEYCGIVYDKLINNLLPYGTTSSNEDREKFISDLSLSLQERYAALKMPYGATEQNLIRYVQDHGSLEVKD